jgi:hypothetical protein
MALCLWVAFLLLIVPRLSVFSALVQRIPLVKISYIPSSKQALHLPRSNLNTNIVNSTIDVATTSYFLVRCRSYGTAYSAAWLAPKEYILQTKYPDKMTLEWHSHNLYMAVSGRSYKIEAPHEFKSVLHQYI